MAIEVWGLHSYHAKVIGQEKTLCGKSVKNMEYQGKNLEDVECKVCSKKLVKGEKDDLPLLW